MEKKNQIESKSELPVLAHECPHVDVCAGCPLMSIPYSQQLDSKKNVLKNLLMYFMKDFEITPSPQIIFHRNRADFWYSPQKQLGFRHKNNRFEGTRVTSCQLISPRAQQAYIFLENYLHEKNIPPYSVLEHKGFLRYISFRESKTNGQLIIAINTFTNTNEDEKIIETLANKLISRQHADGVVWVHNPTLNDTVQGEIFRTWGNCILMEKMSGLPLQYDANCFFQTNPRAAENAQKYVVELIHAHNPKATILDLYCGVGLFSLPLAMKGHFVKGIELSKDSIIWARKNAHNLGQEEVSFEIADVPIKLKEMEKSRETFETILFDPPRSGVSKKIWRRVLRQNPKQIVYVSCNPAALKRDLEWLSEYADYHIENARAFDFFPHSEHVEIVVDIRVEKIKEFKMGG
ncbi:MAG: 23S rRNA (uracil(1939)-C(5))-methyltransferase RlmD [Candidatus Diapherotrites archaeon]|uniref:23S rRNA (Uracil(1939)-C(5))-methyltransferase RlmD n=1 Tax=Candidatus Iainarchaeum sp. TaxID=3101447 RepID=A0A8T4C6B8_9ARCH|nr:23S rRNA (uracil(1939)-C(5))-methyltransferase RlmD [Candidatus Diapherotrites archaeon]